MQMTRSAPPAILFVLSLLVATAGPGLRAQTSGEETFVRVYFDDLPTARQIAAGLEPLESKYEKGYLVVEVTPEQLQRLQQRGLRTEPVNPEELSEMLAPPRASRLDRTRKQSARPAVAGIIGFPCYRTVEETFAAASSIAANNPTLASWVDVGDSWLKTDSQPGYDMRVLVLTNANVSGPKPKMFVTSSIHAREYTPAELMTRFAEDLISNYGVAADATWLLDYHEVHLMLQANPDGRKQAEAGQLWRKNVNENYCGPTLDRRGADLNRNFDFMWDCCSGSSDDPCSNTYHGGYAASEPEVQAVQNYMRSIFPDQRGPNLTDPVPDDATGVYLDIHSSGRLILYPWAFSATLAPNGPQLQTFARKLGFFNLHTPQEFTDFYAADGTTDSFAYGEIGLAAFTLELGTTFFEDCSYFEETILPRNMASLYYAAKVARTPYMTPSGPDVVDGGLSLSAGEWPAVVTVGTSVTLRATLSDSQFNNDNGVEPTQPVVSAEYYIDTPPWVTTPVPAPFTMVDVVDALGDPTDGDVYEASIDTTGLSAGWHIVFVRGKDSRQNWGAFSAIFLGIELREVEPPPPPPPPPRGGGGGGGGGGGLLFPSQAPAALMATAGDGAVRLEWSPPDSDGGSPILRYEYRLKEGREEFGEWTPIEDSAPGEVNATAYTVGGLGNGTVYVFELRAVNAAGNGRVSEAVEAVMPLDPAYWSNFRAEDLEGTQLMLEAFLSGGSSGDRELRFGEVLRFEEDELDGDGEVTATRMGSYGYRYTSRTTGVLSLDFDGGRACELRLTFRREGAGSYRYRCGGVLGGQGSFRMSGLNRGPEITGAGAYEVAENRARVGRIEAVDPDEADEIEGYGIAGGADGGVFAVEAGELMFRKAPDYEDPSDVASAGPESAAADNEYILVVEVRSGEGERERKGSRAIRVRVSDEEEPPEITSVGPFEVVENRTRVGQLEAADQDKPDEITGYGIAGGADGGLFAVVAETGELLFREAPDYEAPSDVASAEPASGAADNEYILVVEVRSGEGERERKGSRAIRVRVSDEEELPEITSLGPFEVVENRTRVGQLEAVDQDKQDEITGYGIAGGADGALFAVEAETGELLFREAPDYENPGDVESEEPQSGAGDNEYIVVVEVRSGEGERERKGSRAIRVRVADEEEPPGAPGAPVVTAEGSDSLKVSWGEPENRGPEIVDYEVRYREGGEAGYSDGGHEGTGLEVRLSGLKEGTVYEVQVRAVNEEGISEWSEPGEGRTDPEEADPEDPSDFTEGDLEGRRLTLRLEGEEGSAGSLELRFGEGNRFEQIESGGEQVATRAEGAARSGSYTYQRTGAHMGRLRLAYDDGASCEIRLSFTESGAGTFSYDCGGGDPAEGSFRLTTGSLFVPVILSAAGRSNSFFTSELTLTNRGDEEVKLHYTYTAHRGGGSGTASEVLAAGRQRVETDALGYLQSLGIPIPETGNRIGTLRVEAQLGSEVEAVVRTTTMVPEGRAGLAYPGLAEEEGFTEAVYLCGLRQNSRDRSNVAFQNMGAEEEGAITLRTTVYSGAAADATARVLEEVRLEPGEFHQYSGLLGELGVPAQGYVKVERVEGKASFYAYGVINDQANSDGSFVFPVTASSLEGRMGQTLPVIVETSAFTSELTVTNFSGEVRTLDFQFVAEQIEGNDKTADFRTTLEAGEQKIIPDVVDELRQKRVAGLGSTRGFYAGPLFVVAEGGDMSGIVIGARTGSEGGGGQYSVFYNAVPEGGAFTEVAWVEGLQQNRENRSNLALVNTGEVDGSPSVFHLEIYDGETGLLAETVVTKPIAARRWHQINGILGSYAPETRQGYIRIRKVSGANPFLAYGVVNDGGAPGERSGDGAYLPARE